MPGDRGAAGVGRFCDDGVQRRGVRLSDGVFAAPAAWLKAAAGRAEVVALLNVDSEIKDGVVDEIEQAAAGAGYEEPFPTTRMLKKAGAATRIAAKWRLEYRRRSIARSSA